MIFGDDTLYLRENGWACAPRWQGAMQRAERTQALGAEKQGKKLFLFESPVTP
jgi:hypothetical protein